MIDIENEIYSAVSIKIRERYPEIYITGEYVATPTSFPCVSVIEQSNYAYQRSRTSTNNENHVEVMYEVNVYSNKKTGKKAEAKAIMNVIDKIFNDLGFTRIMQNPVPNLLDATIYRIVARYAAIVGTDKVIYRR